MKKLSIIPFLLLIAHVLPAQESYFRFSVGYGLPAGSQMLAQESSYTYNSTGASGSEKGVYGSYGSGLVLNAAYGHMYTPNLGLDLSLQYLMGHQYEGTDSYRSMNPDGSVGSQNHSTYSSHATGFFFSPAMISRIPGAKVSPYAKLGVVVGTARVMGESNGVSSMTGAPSSTFSIKQELSGGLGWGTRAALGLDFGITKKVNFYTELTLTSMTYFPTELKYTENKIDGVAQPATPATKFKKETTTNSNNPQNNENLGDTYPLGSLALNVGIRIKL